jgi:NADH:ubiquinone oxidoreductase subunit F (NADH-binding)
MPHVHRVLPQQPIESLGDYEAVGGGKALTAARSVEPVAIIEELEISGLRGRGGAGFPTGRKWRTVLEERSDVVPATVVVNAAEGEPGTEKDRAILRANPFHVLEGALIAAYVVGADEIVFGLRASFTDEIARVRAAVAEVEGAGWAKGIAIRLHQGPEEYLFGEETALLESVDGRPPFPRIAPPFRRGVDEVVDTDDTSPASGLAAQVEMTDGGLAPPALVDNVETLANVPGIVREGAKWFRSVGTEQSPGTIVCTITGQVRAPGIGEVAMGTTIRDAIDEIAGGSVKGQQITAVLCGASAAPLPAALLDTQLTYEAMAEAGSGLGSAGYIVLDDTSDLVAAVAGVSRFLAVESCGQCTPCKLDGLAISDTLARIARNDGSAADVQRLRDLVGTVADGARCSIGPQHEAVVGGLLRTFGDAVVAHVDGRAEATEPMVIGEAGKQPDWTFEETWSGETPADRQTDHRVETPSQ